MDLPVLHMPLGGGFCWSAASERASWQGSGAHSIKAYCVPATSDGQRFRLVSCERAGEGGWCDQSKLTRPPCWRRAGEKRESGKTRATVTSVYRSHKHPSFRPQAKNAEALAQKTHLAAVENDPTRPVLVVERRGGALLSTVRRPKPIGSRALFSRGRLISEASLPVFQRGWGRTSPHCV